MKNYIKETPKGYDIDYIELVKYLKRNGYIFHNEMPFHYENGVYRLLSVNEFCNSILPNQGTGKTLQEKQKIMERCFVNDLMPKSVDETNYIIYNEKKFKVDNAIIINCKNCIILINKSTGKIMIIDHDRRNIFFQQIPVNYNINVMANDYDEQYLNNIRLNGEENVRLLFEMLGASIGRTCDKSIFNILGKANSGKSTLVKVIQNLIGDEYITNFNSRQLNEESKEIHQMLNAYVNIADDDDMNFNNNGTFLKRLSGGGATIPFQVKFKKEPIKGVFKTKLIFTSNDMISINYTTRDTEALLKRLVILPLDVPVSKNNMVMDIEKKLNYEYWLYQSIEALCQLIKNNFEYTQCANIENFIVQDDFTDWFLSNIEKTNNPNDYITNKDLYEDYRIFCIDNACEVMSERAFGHKISKMLNQKATQKKINGKNNRCYIGIKLNYDNNDMFIK